MKGPLPEGGWLLFRVLEGYRVEQQRTEGDALHGRALAPAR